MRSAGPTMRNDRSRRKAPPGSGAPPEACVESSPRSSSCLASPYTRAWQTAEILRDDAAWPAPERCPALEGDKAPAAALEPLQQHGERSSVALVGHEPYLSSLASLLLAKDERSVPIEMKKGGVIFLELALGSATLRWSASPKILRGLDGDR